MGRGRDKCYARHRAAHTCDYLINLEAGQLTTLTRFGPLCHLDLNLIGVDKVFGIHAESA